METILNEPHAVFEQASISQDEANAAHLEKLECIQIYNERGRRDYQLGGKLHPIDIMFEFSPEQAEARYGFPTLRQLLEAPRESGGLDIPYSSAMRAVRIYSLMVRCGIEPEAVAMLDYSKLDLLNKVLTAENAEDWLIKARDLSRDDLRKELGETDREPKITTTRRLKDMDAGELRGVINALRKYLKEVSLTRPEYKENGKKLLEIIDSMIEFE